jgi:hypothetical protein
VFLAVRLHATAAQRRRAARASSDPRVIFVNFVVPSISIAA